jgi:hypothetical protein
MNITFREFRKRIVAVVVLTVLFYLLIVFYSFFCYWWDGIDLKTMTPAGGYKCLFLSESQSSLFDKYVLSSFVGKLIVSCFMSTVIVAMVVFARQFVSKASNRQ